MNRIDKVKELLRLARALDWEKDPNPKNWKTINGAKVHLDKNGNYDGGAGGKFNGSHHYGPDYKEKNKHMNNLANVFSQVVAQKQAQANAQGNGQGNIPAQNVASKATPTKPVHDIIADKRKDWIDRANAVQTEKDAKRVAGRFASEYREALNSVTSLQEWQNEVQRIPHEVGELYSDLMRDSALSGYAVNLITDELTARLNGKLDVTKNPPPAIRKEIEEKMRPAQVANAKRGNPMSEEQANKGNANPNFYMGRASGYWSNCQTCVVAYELRRRGYDVSALPKLNNTTMDALSHNACLAWIDPNTGQMPIFEKDSSVTTPLKTYSWLKKKVESGGRYTVKFTWDLGKGWTPNDPAVGHIVHVRKDGTGEVEIYDPQSGRIEARGKAQIKQYFSDVQYNKRYGRYTYTFRPGLLRVDTLVPNPNIVDKILT